MIIRGNLKPTDLLPLGRSVSSAHHAIAAAIEARRARYIELACGHLTTWEAHQVYLIARPRKDKFYCEVCSKWVFPATLTKKREAVTGEPLF